jgi:putative acetyltransferase
MIPTTLTIRPEGAGDRSAIYALHCAAFGGEAEADLVDDLRRERAAVLSLVAEENGRVIGHVLYSRLAIGNGARAEQALSLAPIAVAPRHQRQGTGARLIEDAHRRLAARGETLVFVLGEPDYYRRFGFSAAAARPFKTPYDGPDLMALALAPGGAAAGTVRYPAAFTRLG